MFLVNIRLSGHYGMFKLIDFGILKMFYGLVWHLGGVLCIIWYFSD